MALIILLILFVLLGAAAFGVALAVSGRNRYAAQADLAPGLSTNAPAAWAGAHSPEARLHRRLSDAVTALRDLAGDPAEDVRLLELRVQLEQEAIEVDHRLVAVAAMPPFVRTPALEALEPTVVTVEEAAADLITLVKRGTTAPDQRRLDDLTSTIRLVAEARTEVAALDESPEPTTEHGEGTTQTG